MRRVIDFFIIDVNDMDRRPFSSTAQIVFTVAFICYIAVKALYLFHNHFTLPQAPLSVILLILAVLLYSLLLKSPLINDTIRREIKNVADAGLVVWAAISALSNSAFKDLTTIDIVKYSLMFRAVLFLIFITFLALRISVLIFDLCADRKARVFRRRQRLQG